MKLKRAIKGIFLSLDKESISSEYISYLCNVDVKKVEKILIQLENEGFIR